MPPKNTAAGRPECDEDAYHSLSSPVRILPRIPGKSGRIWFGGDLSIKIQDEWIGMIPFCWKPLHLNERFISRYVQNR